MKKLKCYVLMLSKSFPSKHPRSGQATCFFDAITNGEKIHTIRANYKLWKKRIDDVNKGVAYISVREWINEPYKSKQYELFKMEKGALCDPSIQELNFRDGNIHNPVIGNSSRSFYELAENDGLSWDDFNAWFKGYNLTETLAIIHFTNFKYS